MGAWGTGLYSDDTACDVRDDYRDILGDGVYEPEATEQIIEQWEADLTDQDIAPVFWLTLADVQWKLGRLQTKVKQEALKIIDNGTDLARWSSDKKLQKKRKAVLERLKQKLYTAQPAAKKIKKRYVDSTDWRLGDVYSFQLRSGNYVLLHVIGFNQDNGGRGPVCAILDWYGEEYPDEESIEVMQYRYANEPCKHLCQFLFGSLSAKDFKKERVNLLFQNIKPRQTLSGYSVILWRVVDEQFETFFGLK